MKETSLFAGPQEETKKPAPESASRPLPEHNAWKPKKAYRYNSGVYYKGERK